MTMEILLVEDNAGDAVLIRQILADGAVPVNHHIVRDGEQALTLLSDADWRSSLIILDLNIPRISETALLERWKSQNIQVVVFGSSLNAGWATRDRPRTWGSAPLGIR